jgi:hypothetical protein
LMHEVFQSGLGEYQVSGDKDCHERITSKIGG